ncbi:MAG TPA: hypothetical protein VJU78_00375, partial [Chitinophagaceae bacterium]|nr:hypothetical protein [Chitinophagaceae bacterium]
MQTAVLHMAQQPASEQSPETILTFRPFVNYLKARKDETNCHKNRFFSFVVEQFEKSPELLKAVDINKAKDYADQMQLIYSMVSPVIEDEDKHLWALSLPLKPVIFYSTNAYFNLVANIATGNLRKSIVTKSPEEIRRQRLEFTYSLILEKLYNIPSFFSRDIVHSLDDEETGLTKYFKLNLDVRFIEIYATRAFPELKAEELRLGTHDHAEALAFFEKRLPLDLFRFEGFGITTITDVTAEYALENIKNIILNRSSFEEESYYTSVINSLKALAGSNDIEFGLLPVLKVNNKLVFNDTECVNSKLMGAACERGMGEMTYMSLANE